MFVKMRTRNSIINTHQATPLRRSPRFLHQKSSPEKEESKAQKSESRNKLVRSSSLPLSSTTVNVTVKATHQDFPKKVPNKSSKLNDGSRNCANLSTGSRKSPRLNNMADGCPSLRRSPRFSNQKSTGGRVEKTVNDKTKKIVQCFPNKSTNDDKVLSGGKFVECDVEKSTGKEVLLNAGKGKGGTNSFKQLAENIVRRTTSRRRSVGSMKDSVIEEVVSDGRKGRVIEKKSEGQFVERSERRMRKSCVHFEEVKVEGGDRKAKSDKSREEIGMNRKRKRGEEGNVIVQGWTNEQELALQRAYFAAKPTPHFWKKVSKLVPGKSAQDCFNKVHSDHITPPQPQPRSRAKRINLSSFEHFSLSASKLLKPTESQNKRPSCHKKKSHLAQKTVRELLEKHCHVDQDHEVDLFSVLEPNIDSSTQPNANIDSSAQPNVVLSTPKHLQENEGFLLKCHERSSSGHKKPLSRFSSSCGTALVSPPVLKPVKNRALHEKYIDQLHCRESKRKAASARADKSFSGKENRRDIHVQKIDVVRATKNTLVTNVRDAINQLHHLQDNSVGNSSDFDDDGIDDDDDENEL